MKSIYLHLCSEMPAIFVLNGEQVGYVENHTDSIDILADESDYLLNVYPIEQLKDFYSLSYSAKLNFLANKLHCTHPNITITDYGQSHFRVEALPLTIPNNSMLTTSFYSTVEECSISIAKNTLIAQDKQHSFSYLLPCQIFDIKSKKVANFLVLEAKTAENKDYLLLLNKNLQLQFEGISDKIEFDGTKIITLKTINDIARHGLVTTYTLTPNGFAKNEQYSVLTQNEPVSPANFRALPWAFMEAINIKNFTLARSYLHPNLSQSLKDEHISAYFGDFIEVTPSISGEFNVLALTYNGNPRFVKNYKFDILENRIFNIDCLD